MLVQVYRNSRRRCWSVRDAKSRRVIRHVDHLVLKNAQFKVSEPGRQRVLRNRVKNVHAWVQGELLTEPIPLAEVMICNLITYNPYLDSTFVSVIDKKPVDKAKYVIFGKLSVFTVETEALIWELRNS